LSTDSCKEYKTIVIVLESPHIKEYLSDNKFGPTPAIGRTGTNLQKYFNHEKIFENVEITDENKNYRVIVVTRYAESHTSVMDYLTQFKCITARRLNSPYVYFENGSVIRMLSLASTARGYKGNLVLCTSSIFDDENSCKFRAMESDNRFFTYLTTQN
jgi:hypothetical protein